MEFIATNRACGVEPLTNHIVYNSSSMPSLPSFTTLASQQLFILAGAKGIEPLFQAPKTHVLPLDDTPIWSEQLDSNLWNACALSCFQDRCNQSLCQLSVFTVHSRQKWLHFVPVSMVFGLLSCLSVTSHIIFPVMNQSCCPWLQLTIQGSVYHDFKSS